MQTKIDTLAHLESQLMASIALQSPEEYKRWLELYVIAVIILKFMKILNSKILIFISKFKLRLKI